MIIRDPCKRCIVQPMCKDQCHSRDGYIKTINALSSIVAGIILFFIGYILAILLMGKEDSIIFLIGCHTTVLLSVLQFLLTMKQRKIRIYNEKRFRERLFRPIQPPPGPGRPMKGKGPIR